MWSTHNGARSGEAPNQPSRMAVDDVRRTDMRARKYSTDPTTDHLRDDGFLARIYRVPLSPKTLGQGRYLTSHCLKYDR